jgi:SagB-type dehydrogenase family enzyme
VTAAATGLPQRRRFRRSPGLVLCWDRAGLVAVSAAGARRRLAREIVDALELLDDWQSVEEFHSRHKDWGSKRDIARLFNALLQRGLVEGEHSTSGLWRDWSEASFFHFSTRGGHYSRDLHAHDRALRAKARTAPPPQPTKSLPGIAVPLPDPQPVDGLERVLLQRRTWRNFSPDPVSVRSVSSLLRLTWGVQKRATVKGQGPVVLKTSPSGGARHPVEAYLLSLNVADLERGVFHYDAAAHTLTNVKTKLHRRALVDALAGQTYFANAAAIVVMSAVFARSMWRYSSSRAYRVVIADLGHLGQTFCLVATALGLAPFCTMAFDDGRLDALIGVDGVAEAAMYVVGVGAPAAHASRPGALPKGDV